MDLQFICLKLAHIYPNFHLLDPLFPLERKRDSFSLEMDIAGHHPQLSSNYFAKPDSSLTLGDRSVCTLSSGKRGRFALH